jgi:predicted NAD/FAD-binding protein
MPFAAPRQRTASSELLASDPNRRLAIIGGGMGGLSTAYFCDSEWTIDLFESRSELGGNADTVIIQEDGQDLSVDVGADSFNPGTHPMYWALLQEIDAIRSPKSADDLLIEVPATLSIFDARTRRPLFASTHPLHSLNYAINFAMFARAALRFLSRNPSCDVTAGEWFDRRWLDRSFKQNALLPWLASLTCYSVETFKTQSMLSFLLLFARTFPESIFRSPKSYNSSIGLGGILKMLPARCQNLSIHTNAAVSKLEEVNGLWFIETPSERHGPYENVIVNAPPYASRGFMSTLPSELLDLLGKHEYYSARIVIHRDPIYMPADRNYWCSHNAAVDVDSCEGSVWLGSARKNAKTGKPIQLFKSWASKRELQPKDILAERTFLHPMLSPDTMRATKQLRNWQGFKGLFFTGHYMTLTDLQETALYSGMAVAKVLNPASQRLQSLQQRLAKAGHADVSYDVDNFH